MTKQKSSAKKVSSASKRTQNAWETRKKIAAEKENRIDDLICKNEILEIQNQELKKQLSYNQSQEITAQSLKQDYESLIAEEVDLQKRIFIKKNEIKAFTAKNIEDLKLIESYC